MLFEKITYRDDFPINITIGNIKEYPIHYHQDNEFVIVLKGSLILKNGCCNYTLKAGDIFTNSGHEVHSLYGTGEDNMVAIVQISTHFFSQYFPNLTKSCYRTYTNKESGKKHDALREKLLQVILNYSVKSFNYKTECTYMMVNIIKYLDSYFNLFAFDEDTVINFESGNQVTIERISRIIGYIYEYHAEKITLDDLAEMEHLSTFYLSHIIKNCTGMNFREFLCFARVEWSQIELLETKKKISKIAKDVGFSTTSYYEKYFMKWYGSTPQDYRDQNLPFVLSDTKRPALNELDNNQVISEIKKALSALNSQIKNESVVNSFRLDVNVEKRALASAAVDYACNLYMTMDDLRQLGHAVFDYVKEINPRKAIIMTKEGDSPEEVKMVRDILNVMRHDAEIIKIDEPKHISSFAFDSIAYPIYILNKHLKSKDSVYKMRLRDPDINASVIKGYPAAITSNGIRKPVFYAYKALSFLSGEIIDHGNHHVVIRTFRKDKPSFIIITYNYNNEILNLCSESATAQNVNSVIGSFRDEMDISFNLSVDQGLYSVIKYDVSRNDGVFAYMSVLGFPERSRLMSFYPEIMSTEPTLEMYVEDIRSTLSINFSIKGAGIQLAVITPKE